MVLLTGCDLFVSQEKKTRELVEQEMVAIDWNEVDSYPLFANCDETLTKAGQRACFEQEVLSYFTKALEHVKLTPVSGQDTLVQVDFLVDREGQVSILEIQKTADTDEQLPDFDAMIADVLEHMPKLQPALKRGIPVKARFRIPIVLGTVK